MTDERSKEGLDYLRLHGGVLLQDLLTHEDRQAFGWPVIYTDVVAMVEKSLAAHADFFMGQLYSSVSGGVIYQRATRGLCPETTLLI